MLFLIAAWSLVAGVTAGVVAGDVACHACIHNTCYSRHSIRPVNGTDLTPLAVDPAGNTLYIGYKDRYHGGILAAVPLNDSSTATTVRYFKDLISGASIDPATRDLYLYSPGHQGVYKYAPTTSDSQRLESLAKITRELQFKDNKLYYTYWVEGKKVWSRDKFLMRQGGMIAMEVQTARSEPIQPLSNYTLENFIIDKEDDIYFYGAVSCLDCVNNLYRLRHGSEEVERLSPYLYDLYLDADGTALFLSDFEDRTFLYRWEGSGNALSLVGTIEGEDLLDLVFEGGSGRIYYRKKGESRSLFYLSPEPGATCVVQKENV